MLVASLFVAGALGAPARYLLDGFVQSRTHRVFPWGTFVVNVSGSFVLGIITGWALYHGLGNLPHVAIGTGFCGAFTTFSTFSYETVRLLEEGSVLASTLNALGSVAAGMIAAAAGLALMAAD
jgi:CrcB protein